MISYDSNIRFDKVIDAFCVFPGCIFLLLTILYSGRLWDWQYIANGLIVHLIAYSILAWFIRNFTTGRLNIFLHTAVILFLVSFYFQTAGQLQHIFWDSWMDPLLVSTEIKLIGVETSILLEEITNPFLTEWMMFAYVFYIPLLPFVAFACFFSSGYKTAKEYLFNILVCNAVCCIGFIIFPVASQMYFYPEVYTVPLEGGIFTFLGELIRDHVHFPGGSLPSPHCTATTIMMVFLFRHNRNIFYLLLPVILTIYISTVYGRYHYVWDCFAGILSAIFVLKFSPKLAESLNNIIASLAKPEFEISISQSKCEGGGLK